MAGYGLSKSRITAWRQCPKRSWLQIHRKDLLHESDKVKQLYRAGNEVGDIARQLCSPGILIENQNNLSAAIADTRSALDAHPELPIFEATFQHEGLLVQADVLLPTRKGYRMTEVKSSTSVKPYHIEDCAVQAWVLKQNKVKLATVELAHIDTSFVYRGDGDYHGLLKSSRLDSEVKDLLNEVPGWVSGARLTLAGDEPCITPGAQCVDPFECPFKAYCTRGMEMPEELEYPLDVLHRMNNKMKNELRALGYVDARHVPARYLTDTQLLIQQASKSGIPFFDQQAAKREMSMLPYPRYYVDFETIAPLVPLWPDTSPFSPQVPFQWSCHIEYAPGQLRHEMFLDVSGDDPRRAFAESLIQSLGNDGPVLVYNAAFEKGRVSELANRFTDLALALLLINDRVVDLLPLARSHYYHPEMKGSWSIKAVLPTIAPDLSYDEQVVGNGGDAQLAYLEITDPATTEQNRQRLKDGLREYCTLDTLAMVRLAWFFEGRENNQGDQHAK